jgi:protein-tyrosine phosphatase
MALAGLLDAYEPENVATIRRLVFICKGNICRSPYAEAHARALGLPAISAGLEADPGKPANERFAQIARSLGVDLSTHRARHVSALELSAEDFVIAFEPAQADALRALYAGASGRAFGLLGMFRRPRAPYIHDPYGASDEYARACALRINEALDALSTRLAHLRHAVE